MQLLNERTGRMVASDVSVACTRETRRRGLLQHDALDPSSALVLSPCFAIHTAFMRFPIDVLFVDGEGVVRRVVSDLPAWRMAVDVRARAVIEFAGGVLARQDVRVGDRVAILSSSDEDARLPSPVFRRVRLQPDRSAPVIDRSA